MTKKSSNAAPQYVQTADMPHPQESQDGPLWLDELRDAIARCSRLNSPLVPSAEKFCHWAVSRHDSPTGIRRADALKAALGMIYPLANQVLAGFIDPKQLKGLFANPKEYVEVRDTIEEALATVDGELNADSWESVAAATDLVIEIVLFCDTLHPKHITLPAGRTRYTSEDKFCELCFRYTHRFHLLHSRSDRKIDDDNPLGTIISASINRDSGKGKRAQLTYDIRKVHAHRCMDRHSTRGNNTTTGGSLRGNRGFVTKQGNQKARQRMKSELQRYVASLSELGLARPHSVRLMRMVAWYRSKPVIAQEELHEWLGHLSKRRPSAQKLLDHLLSPIGIGQDPITVSDSLLEVETHRDGYRHIRYHDDQTAVIPPMPEAGAAEKFNEVRRLAVNLVHPSFGDKVFQTALFHDLGLELTFVDKDIVRVVFDSPEWLRAAIV